MSINGHKIVLIVGACDKKHRLHSYVTESSNGANLQIIDVTKDLKELQAYDQSYLDYINQTVSYFIGDEIDKIDAVIFYSMETRFNIALIKKLNPQCQVIHYSEENLTETKIIEHIGLYEQNIESKNDSDKKPVPAPTNSQLLSQGFAGFFVRKKAAFTLSESENIFDVRWPI